MPVSNPSYFPDQRGNGSVVGITAGRNQLGNRNFLALSNAGNNSDIDGLIVIGQNAAAAGMTDNANLAGSILIGDGAAPFLTLGVGNAAPLTLLGANNLARFGQLNPANGCDSTVIVGSQILNGEANANISTSVWIGTDLFPLASVFPACTGNVIIGDNIGTAAPLSTPSIPINTVMIGSALFTNVAASQYAHGVFIGSGMEITAAGLANGSNIAIGAGITVPPSGNNISMGQGGYANTGGAATDNVCIGAGAFFSGNSNVIIGAGAVNPQIAGDADVGCVIIGTNAGSTIVGSSLTNVFLVESATATSGPGAVPSALLYGSFLTGSLILGDSTVAAANRDLHGTNTVKLLNGTVGAAPVGGGYFYVTAGALHWVGSGGTDTPIAPA